MKVKQLAYHRNGICGTPFWVAIIEDEDGRDKVVIRFPGECRCAALDIDLLEERKIAFGENSWRGDHYVDDIDAAIRAIEDDDTPDCSDETDPA